MQNKSKQAQSARWTHYLRQWFALPVFDGDEIRTSRVKILSIIIPNLLLISILMSLNSILGERVPVSMSIISIGLGILSLILWFMLRAGHVTLASLGISLFALVPITAGVISTGTIRSPITAFYLLMIVSTSLVFDLAGIMVSVGTSSLLVLCLVYAENAGWLRAPDLTVTFTQWVTYSILFLLTGIFSYVGLRSTRQALARTKQEIAERQQVEELYQALVTASPDGIVLIAPTGHLLFTSPQALQMVGHAPSDNLVGRSILDWFPPHEHGRVMKNLNRVLQTEYFRDVEYELQRQDGSCFFCEIVTNQICDSKGQIRAVIAVIHDISERKQKETIIAENNRKLELLFELLPVGISIRNHGGQVVKTNSALEKIIGQDLFENGEHQKHQYLRPDGTRMPPTEYASTRAIHNGTHALNVETGVMKENGQVVWTNTSAILTPFTDWHTVVVTSDITAIKQAQHELKALNATLEQRVQERTGELLNANVALRQEIIERQRVEEALRASEEQLQLVFQSTNDGIWDWDARANVTIHSPRYAEMLGYTSEQLEAESRYWHLRIHPDDLSRALGAYTDHLAGRTPFYTSENRQLMRTGEWLWVLDRGQVVKRDAEGNPLRVVGTHTDITALKHAEEELRISEEQNRLLFEESPDPTVLVNGADEFVRLNRAYEELTGYSREALLGHPISEFAFVSQETRARILETIQESHARGEAYTTVEFTLRRADGQTRDAEARVYSTNSNEHKRILYTIRDISERKKSEQAVRASRDALSLANQELARANKLKDEFLANMSHELRTPLNGILGFSEGLLEQILGPLNEKQTSAITAIQTSGQHLLSLINEILDLAKIESGEMHLNPEHVMPKVTSQASMLFIKQLAHKKNIKTFMKFDPDVDWMVVDEKRLKQVLVNLLTNAVKFTPEGGQIGLEVIGDAENNIIQFTVWDTGIGIDDKDISRLFQPFVQLDGSLTRQYEGTGLGLSLVKRLIEMHDGNISVESAVGKGSRFICTLPWTEEMRSRPRAETDVPTQSIDAQARLSAIPSGNNHGPLVLVAEDNQVNTTMLSDYLYSKGYRVASAQNGSEALQIARAQIPAVILMDLQMPVMDGLDATRVLRSDSNPKLAPVPIIALTALAMPGDREKAMAAGADEYMSKPVNLKELVKMIERLLNRP